MGLAHYNICELDSWCTGEDASNYNLLKAFDTQITCAGPLVLIAHGILNGKHYNGLGRFGLFWFYHYA